MKKILKLNTIHQFIFTKMSEETQDIPINKKEKSPTKCYKFFEKWFIIFIIFLALFIIVGSIVWFVYGVLYSNEYKRLCYDCFSSNIREYVVVSIVLYLNKYCVIHIRNNPNFNVYLISGLIELSLCIWGAIELFINTKSCYKLKKSRLWDFALATFIAQLCYIVIIVICFIRLKMNKLKENSKV